MFLSFFGFINCTVDCSAAGSRSRVTFVSRPQGRRNSGTVLRRDRDAAAARHVAQGRPGNDVIGARARDADARRNSRLDRSLFAPAGTQAAADHSSPSSALFCAATSIFLQLYTAVHVSHLFLNVSFPCFL